MYITHTPSSLIHITYSWPKFSRALWRKIWVNVFEIFTFQNDHNSPSQSLQTIQTIFWTNFKHLPISKWNAHIHPSNPFLAMSFLAILPVCTNFRSKMILSLPTKDFFPNLASKTITPSCDARCFRRWFELVAFPVSINQYLDIFRKMSNGGYYYWHILL